MKIKYALYVMVVVAAILYATVAVSVFLDMQGNSFIKFVLSSGSIVLAGTLVATIFGMNKDKL